MTDFHDIGRNIMTVECTCPTGSPQAGHGSFLSTPCRKGRGLSQRTGLFCSCGNTPLRISSKADLSLFPFNFPSAAAW